MVLSAEPEARMLYLCLFKERVKTESVWLPSLKSYFLPFLLNFLIFVAS